MDDIDFIQEAYSEALVAYKNGENPIGALIVMDGKIISRASNAEISKNDPTAHAEIEAIRKACNQLNQLKLKDCVLYTTLYPCPMCEGAIIEVDIKKVIYGGETFKWIKEVRYSNKNLEYIGPILNEECRQLFAKKIKEKGGDEILKYESS